MNQKEYAQIIGEMSIPAIKILGWANLAKEQHYSQFTEVDRELFDRVLASAEELVELIPKLQQLKEKHDRSLALTHNIAGPIMIIRGDTQLILASPEWKPEEEQSQSDKKILHYIREINVAAEYLAVLDRDSIGRDQD